MTHTFFCAHAILVYFQFVYSKAALMELTVNTIRANQFALCKVLWLRWQEALRVLNTPSLSPSTVGAIVYAGRRQKDEAVEKVSDEQ